MVLRATGWNKILSVLHEIGTHEMNVKAPHEEIFKQKAMCFRANRCHHQDLHFLQIPVLNLKGELFTEC